MFKVLKPSNFKIVLVKYANRPTQLIDTLLKTLYDDLAMSSSELKTITLCGDVFPVLALEEQGRSSHWIT